MEKIGRIGLAALLAAILCLGISGQPTAGSPAAGAPAMPLSLDSGYEVWNLAPGGMAPGTAPVVFALDRSSLTSVTAKDMKIIVDIAILEPGSRELPKAFSESFRQASGKALESSVLRFGVYGLQADGTLRELAGSFKKPVYVAVSAPSAATYKAESLGIWFPKGAKADGPWTSVAPFGIDAGKENPPVRATGIGLGAEGGGRTLLIRIDSWPLGDPYIILPGK